MTTIPTPEELQRRYEIACDLKQPVDREKIIDAMGRFARGVSKHPVEVRIATSQDEFYRAAWDARDARDARAAWDARDAWDARAARAAWDASWDLSWLSITAVGAAALGDQKTAAVWLPLFEAFEAGAFVCLWLPDAVVVAVRPEVVLVDDRRRLHAENAPAFRWLGVDDYWHHGVLMPSNLAADKSLITAARIDAETNAEVRRVLIEWFGVALYVRESGAGIVHADVDQYGRPRRLLRRDVPGDEPIVMIEVTNSTAEPDGSFRTYMLRVDPNAYGGRASRECHAAVASLCRRKSDRAQLYFKRPEDYAPRIET